MRMRMRMRMRATCGLAVLAIVAAACAPAGPKPEQTADTIYIGGDIVTVNDAQPDRRGAGGEGRQDPRRRHARARSRRPTRAPTTQVVDLGGKTLLPGFIDAHSHYINSLSVANQAKLYAPPAGPGKDVDSIIAELQAVRRGATRSRRAR